MKWELINTFCENCNKSLVSLSTRSNDSSCLCSDCYDTLPQNTKGTNYKRRIQ